MKFSISARWAAILAVGVLLCGRSGAQTLIDLRAQGKNVDFSGSATTRPVKTGTDLPSVCQTGQLFFKTDAVGGQNLYGCVATNTWAPLGAPVAGPGGVVQAGTVGGVVVTNSAGITSVDADAGFLMTTGNHNSPSGNMTPSAGVWNLTSVAALVMRNGASDPATCTVGELFVNISATPVLKLCTATDVWTTAAAPSPVVPGGPVRLLASGTGVPSCPATPTTIASYTIPAATLAVGDVVDVRAYWRKSGNANPGQMRVRFGGAEIGGVLTLGANDTFAATETAIFVVGASAQRSFSRGTLENNTTVAVTSGAATAAVANPITVAFVAAGCSGGDMLSVDWFDIMVKKNAN